jgi:hypothetical protein
MSKTIHIAGSKLSKTLDSNGGNTAKPYRHLMPMGKIIAKIQAYKTYKEIKSALKHVRLVNEGKVKPETIDDFLNEV